MNECATCGGTKRVGLRACPTCEANARIAALETELAAERARTDTLVCALKKEFPVECGLPVLGPMSTAAVADVLKVRSLVTSEKAKT